LTCWFASWFSMNLRLPSQSHISYQVYFNNNSPHHHFKNVYIVKSQSHISYQVYFNTEGRSSFRDNGCVSIPHFLSGLFQSPENLRLICPNCDVSIPHFLSGLFQLARFGLVGRHARRRSQSHISYQVYFNSSKKFFSGKRKKMGLNPTFPIRSISITEKPGGELQLIESLNPTFPIRSISIDHLVIICNPAS